MAPKRSAARAPPPPPPPDPDSSEEIVSDESEEEESEEELVPVQKGEESDASDEVESEDRVPISALNSSATKNAQRTQNHEESDASDEEEEEEGESTESEKALPLDPPPKQGARGKGREAKRPAFQRIWTTEDEVRIVEALAAHRREHGKLPQIDALVATLAGNLDNREFGRKELQAKVNTLKRRYEAATKKAERPSNGHDRLLFDLSKSVWGSDDAAGAAAAVASANDAAQRGFDEMCELYPHLAEEVKTLEAAHPGLFKRDFGKLDDDKARCLDSKIKKQRIAEISVELRRGDLTKEVTKVLADLLE
ncbi:hypothetical protein GUJ93_ZPchr0006g46085 [Zizania palustris]|uniref:Glabrous enhancer-binding protein-like DBD domain-containing protein n=1 Tax=Zizania palustris TaxID=103762 RepID=A0A8J5T1J4_ZIZPA|nr:hypothetical protein GUJ93_ZPchr0006g46085 [Zizania palustris]